MFCLDSAYTFLYTRHVNRCFCRYTFLYEKVSTLRYIQYTFLYKKRRTGFQIKEVCFGKRSTVRKSGILFYTFRKVISPSTKIKYRKLNEIKLNRYQIYFTRSLNRSKVIRNPLKTHTMMRYGTSHRSVT